LSPTKRSIMKTKCIAIAENEKEIITILGPLFIVQGYKVISIENETELSDLGKHPDLLIMDTLVGKVSGQEICDKLKRNPLTSHIPVILVSAGNNLVKTDGVRHADIYINKPIDTEIFIEVAKGILEKE
jgi:response regulator RpfG family c-di-GMP phosphodiesterase